MGAQKYESEHIYVGYFCGKRALRAKKVETVQLFFVATYGNEVISVGNHKKKHRPTELFTPFGALYKTSL